MDERPRFIARLLDGRREEFGISRKTGYKVYERYIAHRRRICLTTLDGATTRASATRILARCFMWSAFWIRRV